MLQIISGKFFTSDDLIIHKGLGIAYSNLRMIEPIETCVATLVPADFSGSYIIKYSNQIEAERGERKARLVRIGDTEVVDQFLLLCMFGLRAFFAVDRSEVTETCRAPTSRQNDRNLPSQYIPQFFDPDAFCRPDNAASFVAFVKKVISLKRSRYELTIRYLAALRDALEAIKFNVDLAYSMIVYALEALSQSAAFEPTWGDYDPSLQKSLETSFEKIDRQIADEIKTRLLQSSNLRLQHRFVSFINAHLSESFFGVDAPTVALGLRPSVLPRALRNAYRMRSNFAHSLKPALDQIRTTAFAGGEMFIWDAQPYLTLRGLFRIAEEVIRVFVSSQESVDREDFDWRSNLPGTIRVEMAPQYWVWKHEGLKTEHAAQKLTGLLHHLVDVLQSSGGLTDLRELLLKYEKMLPQSPLKHKRAIIATYWLYNATIAADGKCPNWEIIVGRYEDILMECSPENLAGTLVVQRELPWGVDEIVKCFRRYETQRFNPHNVRIPRLLEFILISEIANKYFDSGQLQEFDAWMKEAAREASGLPEWQIAIDTCRQQRKVLDWSVLLDKRPKSDKANDSGSGDYEAGNH